MALGVSVNGVGLKAVHRRARGYLSQSAVQNTWYTILDTKDDVTLWMVSLYQTNTEAAAKTTELRVTINGNVLTGSTSLASSTSPMYWTLEINGTALKATTTTAVNFAASSAILFAGLTKVEMRITTAEGTNQLLVGAAYYGQTDTS